MGHNEGQISIDKPACLIGRRHESSGTRAVDSATVGPLRLLGDDALAGLSRALVGARSQASGR